MAYNPKSYRKFLTGSLSAAMVATTFGTVASVDVQNADAAEDFSDVSNDYWASNSIQRISDQGILNGYSDGTYRPGDNINRGQVAAMLVTAFDLDVDEDAEAPFEDLNDDSYFTPAADAVKKEGLIKGREDNTQFAAGMDLSREQMATIMVRAFGLEEVENSEAAVTDLDEANDSHKGSIEILAQYDITNTEDGSFRPKESVTRAQFAVFLERALAVDYTLQQGITNVEAVDNTTVDITFNHSVEDVDASDFSFDPALDVVDAEVTESGDSESVVRLTTDEQEEDTDYGFYYQGNLTSETIAGSDKEGEEPVNELSVEDVEGNNLKEVAVTFNQDAADWDNVDKVDSYELEDDNGDKIDIEDVRVDGEKVWLSLEEARSQQDNAALTVTNDVLDEEETFDVEFFDDSTPSAEDAEVVGINTAKVTFNEPINASESDLENAFELSNDDGSSFNIDEVSLQNGNREALITFFSDFEDGSYNLDVTNDLLDFAGYSVAPETFELNVEADEEAPALQDYRNASQNGVTLVYDEEITLEGVDENIVYDGDVYDSDDFDESAVDDAGFLESFYHTNSNNTASMIEVDGNEIHVTFSNDYRLPDGSANVYVNEDAVGDLWENVQDQQESLTVDVEADEEAATVESVEQVSESQNSFKVEFSEEVDSDSAEELDNYQVIDDDGNEVDLDAVSLEEENTATVEFEDNEVIGDFSLVTEGIADLSGNESEEETNEFTMAQTGEVSFGDFTGSFYENNDKTTITVDFNRIMETEGSESVTDLSNYEIDGVNLEDVDGADVDVVNGNEGVEITFDTEAFAEHSDNDSLNDLAGDGNNVTVEMARVADADGNRTSLSGDFEINNRSDGAVGAESVGATANDEITVQFDENLDSFEDDDFEIRAGGENGEDLTISSSSYSDDTAVFNLSSELNDNATFGDEEDAVTISTNGDDISSSNRFGNEVNLDGVEVEDGIAPRLDENRDVVATVKEESEENEASVEVEIPFTEVIDDSSVSTSSFAIEDYESEDEANVNGSTITLVIEASDNEEASDIVADLEGQNISQTATITDDAGNSVDDASAEITVE